MAQLANTEETINTSNVEETALSPVYRRPKDDPSISPNAIELTEEHIIGILKSFGSEFTDKKIKDAINAVKDKHNIFEIKKYINDHRDRLADARIAIQLIEKAKEMGGYFGAEQADSPKNDDKKVVDSNHSVDSKEDEISETNFPVHVFVRMRPLIQSEIEQKDGQIVTETKMIHKNNSTTLRIEDVTARNVRKSAIKRPGKLKKAKHEKKKMKIFKGFRGVLFAENDNLETFKECIMPSIGNIWNGHTVCSFAYGHTGSGKTYTIMGYDKDESPGMYRLTAGYIQTELKKLNATIPNEGDKVLLSCRFAELYQGKMCDLFGNLVECQVRESDNGKIVIRGPTLKDEVTGKVKVAPLTPFLVRENEMDKFIEKLNASLALRKKGSSAVHDESSRSHVFLEMELVTKRLIEARTALWNAEAEIVPIGKELDGFRIDNYLYFHSTLCYDAETRTTRLNEEFTENQEIEKRLESLEDEFIRFSLPIIGCQQRVDEEMKRSHQCVGGKVVFVDLAGNEWGSDSKNVRNDNTVQMKERQQINKSLLALKECVRAMNLKKDHVPFRDSKLTMVLRPHLKADHSTAIMIANISPSDKQIKKTFNTLSYSALVAKA